MEKLRYLKSRIQIGAWGSDLELPTGSVHHILLFMKSCMETLTRNGINYQAQLVSCVERSSSHSTKNFTFDCSFHLCFHPSLSHWKAILHLRKKEALFFETPKDWFKIPSFLLFLYIHIGGCQNPGYPGSQWVKILVIFKKGTRF